MREPPADYLEFVSVRSRPLLRTACLLTGDWHLAEDLVQETLAKMYRSWWRINRTHSPVAYANTVLVRTYLSHRRRRPASETPRDRLPEQPLREDDAALRLTLLQALDQLSPRDRAVLVLRYWEDRSVDETARTLRTSPDAVRTHCRRALNRLRSALGGQLTDLTRR